MLISHVCINLILSNGLGEPSTYQKVNIVSYFRRSTKATNTLHQEQVKENLHPKKLINGTKALINRLPTAGNKNFVTPFESYYSRKPDVSRIRTCGCVAYQNIDQAMRKGDKKLDPRAIERIHVGHTSNGYLLMDVKSRNTYRSCNKVLII